MTTAGQLLITTSGNVFCHLATEIGVLTCCDPVLSHTEFRQELTELLLNVAPPLSSPQILVDGLRARRSRTGM